ncbi:hypothetical protein KP79_PYT15353 [Mizuhopecten yessoensis]|uniref:Uncharacterized protein n=1 Tax=Mizuhopecten yessoensis TaxID=6573 RepID=A0A210QZ05_MIZYE|nr:hypothetical protein KP79_PYT15353 [Mizuhopecten yessoensis]
MLKVLILLSCLVASTLCQYFTSDLHGYPVGGPYMNGGLRSVLSGHRFSRFGRRDYESDLGYGNDWHGDRWDNDFETDMDNQRYLRGLGY